MNRLERTILLLFALTIAVTGSGIVHNPALAENPRAGIVSTPPIDQANDRTGEESAAAALTKLGVPLERDPAGHVRWIEAGNGELTDEAMRYLPGLPRLEWLEAGGGQVTGTGMLNLKDCKALRRLYVHDINLAGDSLAWLNGLRLDALSLRGTAVAGKNLSQLTSPETLTVLNLSNNAITSEDMDQISRFSRLEVLAIENTRVTGDGLSRLKDMKRLNVLNFVGCHIVDADLKYLLPLSNLRIVHAYGCNLSDDAVDDLTKKLPLLAVFRQPRS